MINQVSMHTPATILFVDDHAAVRRSMSDLLRHEGFHVLEAATGQEALHLVQKQPDLVLLDVCLPDLSGFEVCNRIRSNSATAQTPVLHLSGIAISAEERTQALEGGADGYLVKPVDPDELVAHVRALLRLRRTEQALAALSRKLLEAQEAERRRIAHELHDEIGQSLTALKIALHTLRPPVVVREALPCVQDAISSVDRIMQQVRTLSVELHPPMMDDLGLAATLRWHLNTVAEKSGLQVRLQIDTDPSDLPRNVAMAAFRVVQEVLNNVVKHARARSVYVELRRDDGDLDLVIFDDGTGFDVTAARRRNVEGKSFGLFSMEERVRLLGGRMMIRSAFGEGTEIQVRFPLGRPPDEERHA